MTNPDPHPVPELCDPAAAATAGVELLEPREVPLGGPRAMPVLRALPNRPRHLIGAFCFADSYGPVDLSDRPGMAVDPHPHTGLQTVSWLVSGEIDHRDSVGSFDRVEPGGVAIMTAGHGISHSEYTPPEHSGTLHGLQLWTVLPSAVRERAPMFEGVAAVPSATVVSGTHWDELDPTVRVLAPGVARVRATDAHDGATAHLTVSTFIGEYHGQLAETTVFSPLVGVGLAADAALEATLGLEQSFEHGILALGPGVSVSGIDLPVGAIAYLPPNTPAAELRFAGPGHAALIGGEPFDESFVMFWNFIAPDTETVRAARETWQAERDAAFDPSARPRFGVVEGHDGVTLPSPEMPTVNLRPRGRVSGAVPPPNGMIGDRGPTR